MEDQQKQKGMLGYGCLQHSPWGINRGGRLLLGGGDSLCPSNHLPPHPLGLGVGMAAMLLNRFPHTLAKPS